MEKYYCDFCRTLTDKAEKCGYCGKEITNKIKIQVQYQDKSGSDHNRV